MLWQVRLAVYLLTLFSIKAGFLERVKVEEGERCNISGFLEVDNVVGNFRFAPGERFHHARVHVHDHFNPCTSIFLVVVCHCR
ncbi:hypothetical protein Bca4012_018524 [Brassica carinata]